MKKAIEETTRLLLQGTLTKDEADKILLSLSNVSGSLPTDEDIKNFAVDAVEPFRRRGDNMNMAETYITLGAKFVARKITGNDH